MSGPPEPVERSASPSPSMVNATPSHSTRLTGSHSEADATQVNGTASNGADQQDNADDGDASNQEDSVTVKVGEAPKKKKKSRKSKSKRGRVRAVSVEATKRPSFLTGFLMTERSKWIRRVLCRRSCHARGVRGRERLVPRRTTVLRIRRVQTAIQRYHAKRRFDPERRGLFDKYLTYGGVDVTQNMFQGVDTRAFEDMNTAEIIAATATAHVASDKEITGTNGSKWAVDFEACAKGFLSCRMPIVVDLGSEAQIKSHVNTIRNFLNYLLHHNVCPEFEEQIYAARRVCITAEKELWKITQVGRWLPGDFNVACSTIFSGSHKGTYSPDYAKWLPDGEGLVGMSDKVAKQVVMFGIAAAGTEEQAIQFHKLDGRAKIDVVNVYEGGFEITEICFADSETRLFYQEQSADFRILGSLKARPWKNPALPPPDFTEEEERALAAQGHPDELLGVADFDFLLEDAALRFMFVGMKIEATVRELNCGIKYFDTVIAVHPSFHTVLPNEMMLGWKNPKIKEAGEDDSDGEDDGGVSLPKKNGAEAEICADDEDC